MLTAAEDADNRPPGTPLADHVAAYLDHQTAKGRNRGATAEYAEGRLEPGCRRLRFSTGSPT